MSRQIVLIHGLWLSARSWENFQAFFSDRGFDVLVPEWPRKDGDVEQLRESGDKLAGLGIAEVADHLEAYVRALAEPPVIVGHSFGGLFTQMLLDRGLGKAGVAMDPAPPKGILTLPLRQLKAASPALAHPGNRNGVVALTLPQFTYGFVNTFSPEDAKAAFERYAVPDSARILFEAAMANFNPKAASKVNFRNTRAPLLVTAGERDNTVPASVSRAVYKKQRHSPSRTDFIEFKGKPHLLTAGPGWEEVAGAVARWIDEVV